MLQSVVVLDPLWIGFVEDAFCRAHLQTLNLIRTGRTILFNHQTVRVSKCYAEVDILVK